MKSILVIDDDPDIVRMMTLMLEAHNFRVISAQNVDDGLEIISGSTSIDLSIIDFWLGTEPSIDLLDAIESQRPDLPVVVISGGGGGVPLEVSHSVARLSGAATFIQKPFTRDDLIRKVREAVA